MDLLGDGDRDLLADDLGERPAEEAEGGVFEVAGRDIVVRNVDGRVESAPVPRGVSPEAFRHVLAAVDVHWASAGIYPTPAQAHKYFPKIPLKTFSTVMGMPEFQKALELRGIQADREDGLTEQQAFALTLLSDPSDTRRRSVKLADLGVPPAQFRAWMRQPLFASLLHERAEGDLKDAIPMAIQGIVANAESGSLSAQQFILKMTGRYDPDTAEVQNARQVVLTMVESIMKHTDPETRKAILGDVEAKMQSITIMESMKEIG